MAITEDAVREELKNVIDPELFVNIVDLGLVYVVDVQENEDGKTDVHIEMTMTSPDVSGGPAADRTEQAIRVAHGERGIGRHQGRDVASVDTRLHDGRGPRSTGNLLANVFHAHSRVRIPHRWRSLVRRVGGSVCAIRCWPKAGRWSRR